MARLELTDKSLSITGIEAAANCLFRGEPFTLSAVLNHIKDSIRNFIGYDGDTFQQIFQELQLHCLIRSCLIHFRDYLDFDLNDAHTIGLPDSHLEEVKAQIIRLWQERIGAPPQGLPLEAVLNLIPGYDADEADTRSLQAAVALYISGAKPVKPFPLATVYLSTSVTGLKERRDGVEVSSALVYALLSRDTKKAEEAARFFDPELLSQARKFVAKHAISKKEVYRRMRPFLAGLQRRDTSSAMAILTVLKDTYKNHIIHDFVSGVEGLFSQNLSFDMLIARTQTGTLDDLLDNRTMRACPFFPDGLYKYASLDYLLHPDIALLHIVPSIGNVQQKPIGVAIMAFVEDIRGKKYLLIDSVEGGEELQRIRDSVWRPLVYKAIMSFAESVRGIEPEIFVNYRFTGANSVPRKFLDYVMLIQKQKTRVRLRLPHQTETPIYLEAFGDKATNHFKRISAYVLNANAPTPEFQKIEIRYATAEDLGQIISLEASRLPEHQQDPASLEKTLFGSGINLVCTNSQGDVVGYIVSYHVDGKLHIEHIATQEEYPQAFQLLLARFRSEARSRGYGAVSLSARKSVGIDRLVERFGGVRLGEEQLGSGGVTEAYARMEVKI